MMMSVRDRVGSVLSWRTTMQWLLSVVVVLALLTLVTTAYYVRDYRLDRDTEEMINDDLALIGPIVDDIAVVSIRGEKVRGLQMILFEDRLCRESGYVDVGGQREPCDPGTTVQVRISPIVYGIREDGHRRLLSMTPVEGTRAQSYPPGKFDAGHWRVDLSPRYTGDPAIVAIQVQVTHMGKYGPRDPESLDPLELYAKL